MTMAVLGLFAREPVEIEDVACVETSYTGFWDAMRSFGAHVEE
jgi:5-enolpyruvylshikimate-3-phosphate synthase